MKKKPPLRWHVVCLGVTLAKFWKRYDALMCRSVFGGPDCCKVKFVK